MVKIVEVDEQPDADRDDECYEIDPAEFAKKMNLSEKEDVILVAAKGKIKVEIVEPEDSGGVTHDSRHEFDTGDSMDNPCQIEEDESAVLQMDIVEDRFALDSKSPPEFGADERRPEVTYKIVVKSEPDDLDDFEGVGHDAYRYHHCNEMNLELGADDDKEGQFFHGDKDAVHVVSDRLLEKPIEPVDNSLRQLSLFHGDNLVENVEPVDGDSVKGAEEDTYDHCPEMIPKQKIFDEEDEDDVVVV
ncbi:hypothetical protein EJB05_23271, partial [Eragrostis curvula]